MCEYINALRVRISPRYKPFKTNIMELTLTITSPEELSKFAVLLSSLFPVGPQSAQNINVVESTSVSKPARTIKKEKAVQVKIKSEPMQEKPSEIMVVSDTVASDVTPEQLRALVMAKIQSDKANSPKIKGFVEQCGASNISDIQADRRVEFMNLVNEL